MKGFLKRNIVLIINKLLFLKLLVEGTYFDFNHHLLMEIFKIDNKESSNSNSLFYGKII